MRSWVIAVAEAAGDGISDLWVGNSVPTDARRNGSILQGRSRWIYEPFQITLQQRARGRDQA
jgi:hypothetical protein